jgi:hypothetical protein
MELSCEAIWSWVFLCWEVFISYSVSWFCPSLSGLLQWTGCWPIQSSFLRTRRWHLALGETASPPVCTCWSLTHTHTLLSASSTTSSRKPSLFFQGSWWPFLAAHLGPDSGSLSCLQRLCAMRVIGFLLHMLRSWLAAGEALSRGCMALRQSGGFARLAILGSRFIVSLYMTGGSVLSPSGLQLPHWKVSLMTLCPAPKTVMRSKWVCLSEALRTVLVQPRKSTRMSSRLVGDHEIGVGLDPLYSPKSANSAGVSETRFLPSQNMGSSRAHGHVADWVAGWNVTPSLLLAHTPLSRAQDLTTHNFQRSQEIWPGGVPRGREKTL